MEEHAIAPWRLDNPMPLWMRLTDPRNFPDYPTAPKKNNKYAVIEPDGHTEHFDNYIDICQHYAISTGTLSRGMQAGSVTLDKQIYRFQNLSKEKKQ